MGTRVVERNAAISGLNVDGEIATPVPRIGCAHFCRVAILAMRRRGLDSASGVV
jgi:hypothetical protein